MHFVMIPEPDMKASGTSLCKRGLFPDKGRGKERPAQAINPEITQAVRLDIAFLIFIFLLQFYMQFR